jgi:serine/threonine-protein kinase
MTTLATGVVLSGRYRLTERIARGGMGTVWAAEDEVLSRKVAVKVLNEGLASDPRFAERFRREARAAARLTHPNIAGTFDYGEDDDRPYIVMELIAGETLAERLSREGRLSPEETSRIGGAVAQALSYAHAQGIVHRDVKPANVMLTPHDEVKVMDFGIAASIVGASGLTATGAVMGTAKYLSPGQARGDRATPASDVYALGVVMYEALAGTSPFERETPLATAMAQIREEPPPIRDVNPGVPEELATLVHRCLSKDPSDRPKEAMVLAAALRSSASSTSTEPIRSPAAVARDTAVLPAAEVAVPPGRRRPLAWILVAALLAAGLIAFFALRSTDQATVNVPKLVGKTRVAAAAAARIVGLNPEFEGASSGRVIEQRPAPGSEVLEGKTVFLTLAPRVAPSPSPSPPEEPKEHGKGKGKGHDEEHGKGND